MDISVPAKHHDAATIAVDSNSRMSIRSAASILFAASLASWALVYGLFALSF